MEGVKGHNFLLIIQNPEALSVTTEMNNSNSPLSSKTSTLKKLATFKKIIVFSGVQKSQASSRWAQYEASVCVQSG